jgi:Domain of unknown function (DUF4440)
MGKRNLGNSGLEVSAFIFMGMLFFALQGYGQSPAETQVLKLSTAIFKWETENKINLLDGVFADPFFVVNAAGETQTKAQYLDRLNGGTFKHDSIDVEENTATVLNNTATVVGKGKFFVTSSGKKITLHLSYIEIFTRPDALTNWKVLAMKASLLQN